MTRSTWAEARALALATGRAHRLPTELVDLAAATGRVLATPLEAARDIPHFASSAMDGWAVRGPGPWRIVAAGPLADEEARPVVTGGVVDDDVTAVLREESAVVSGGSLRSRTSGEPSEGQHIRPVGGEAGRGETLIASGTVLNPAHISLAASSGVDTISVHVRPRVDLLVTGDELDSSGAPGVGRVRDGFGVQLPSLLGLLGGAPTDPVRVPDSLDATIDALAATRSPLVVTTGGTGGSAADHLRRALNALGARLVVDGVAMRPGGPTLLAELPDGRVVLALPGNPLAAMTALITIGSHVIAGLTGLEPAPLGRVRTRATPGRDGSTLVVPLVVDAGTATAMPWTGAAMTRGLAAADGLLVIPPAGLAEGGSADYVSVPW